LFARAARRPVAVPPALADRLEELLARRCGDTIGLARRAGLAVAGFERVAEAAKSRKVAVLVSALDAAAGGRRQLQALCRGVPMVGVLTADELGAAFGRDRAVNAALGPGPLGRRLLCDACKLAGFRVGALVDPGMDKVPAAAARQDDDIGAK
jgi:uncharacterized protein